MECTFLILAKYQKSTFPGQCMCTIVFILYWVCSTSYRWLTASHNRVVTNWSHTVRATLCELIVPQLATVNYWNNMRSTDWRIKYGDIHQTTSPVSAPVQLLCICLYILFLTKHPKQFSASSVHALHSNTKCYQMNRNILSKHSLLGTSLLKADGFKYRFKTKFQYISTVQY